MAGRDTGDSSQNKKGKAKMSQAAWDKLSNRQKERDYGGSRFESKKAKSSSSRDAGSGDGPHGSGRAGFGEGKERQE